MYDHATLHHKNRYVFITTHSKRERDVKELALIQKAQSILVRKSFGSVHELKMAVYASLVNYLVEKEIVRTAPFDASTDSHATIEDLDSVKIGNFVRLAKSKRGFPLSETAFPESVLTHLNLYNDGKVSNAAILLFGKDPQRFFINSEIRCAAFYGIEVEKPITPIKFLKATFLNWLLRQKNLCYQN